MSKTSISSRITLALLMLIGGLAALGQFTRMETPLGRLSGHELVMVIFIIWVAGHYVWTHWRHPVFLSKNRIPIINFSSPFFWWGIWVGWTVLTTIGNGWWWHSSLLLVQGLSYLGRTLLYVIFALGLWQSVKQKLVTKSQLQVGIGLWLVAQIIFGIGQYLFFPDTRAFKLLGWDDHFNRAFGTLFDPGFFGLIMSLSVFWWLDELIKKQWSVAVSLAAVASLVAVILSYSRASYLALLAGLCIWIIGRKQWRAFLLIPIIGLGIWLAPKDGGGEGQKLWRTNSIAAREEVIVHHTRTLTMAEVWLGRGWYYEGARQLQVQGIQHDAGRAVVDQSIGRNNAQSVDNLYLHIFLSTGLIGSLCFGCGLLAWMKTIWPSILLRSSLVAVLVHSCFSTSLLYPWILLLIAFFLSEQPSTHQKENNS